MPAAHKDVFGSRGEVELTYRFPFGEPLAPVFPAARGPRRVFIFGAYSSALHATWKYGPRPRDRVQALAIANEPTPFWDGADEDVLIAKFAPPFGQLKPTAQNGASGRALQEHYLGALRLAAADCWITDLVNTYYARPNQRDAFRRAFESRNLEGQEWLLPLRPDRLRPGPKRMKELRDEFLEAGPSWVLTLGDEPLQALGLGRLSAHQYGHPAEEQVFGRPVALIPLTHPRNAGRLGRHSDFWAATHANWVSRDAPALASKIGAA